MANTMLCLTSSIFFEWP